MKLEMATGGQGVGVAQLTKNADLQACRPDLHSNSCFMEAGLI
jgi:hypothetical protein